MLWGKLKEKCVEQCFTNLFGCHGPHILYFLTFIVLILCGIGMPIPEEITFIAAGVACHSLNANQWILCMIGVVGILAGDTIPYYAGRRYGMEFLTHKHFAGILSTKNLENTRKFFQKHGTKTIFFARFVLGLRMPTFFMAGSMNMRYRYFIFCDLLGAIISCPTTILASYYLKEAAKDWLREFNILVFIILGIIVAITVFYHWHKKRNKTDKQK
jgi:membrane protein DedA with SNARE-associated domain